MKTGRRRREEPESNSGADEKQALGVAARNPRTLQRQHEGVGAETQLTKKKQIGGAGALERLHEKSTAAAHHKPRTKTERKTAHNFGKRTQTKPTAREGNPSACFVEPENGPGRIDVEAKYKPRDGSFSAERRKEIPHELESTSKITRK
jgi:hypothetical protein